MNFSLSRNSLLLNNNYDVSGAVTSNKLLLGGVKSSNYILDLSSDTDSAVKIGNNTLLVDTSNNIINVNNRFRVGNTFFADSLNNFVEISGTLISTTRNIIGDLSGNSTTSSRLETSRTLWGQNFNGSANVTGNLTSVGNITGTGAITVTAGGTNQNITLTPSGTGTVNAPTFRATTVGGGFQGIGTDTALQPSFTWNGDISTGIYRPTTNTVGITTAGTERMRVSSNNTTLYTNFDISNNQSALDIIYRSSPSSGQNGSVTKNYYTKYGSVFRQTEDTINDTGHYLNFYQSGLSNNNGPENRYFDYYSGDTNALDGFTKFNINARTKLWLRENSEVVLGGDDRATSAFPFVLLRATDMISQTNLPGRDLIIQSGRGRGLGGSGSINFNTSPPDVSGTTLNTPIRRMTILNNGNVGIGTNSPNTLFDVSGTAKFTRIFDTSNNIGSSGQLLSSTGSSLLWQSPSILSVNSANTLTNTRTLWGQNFNGSADVSGNLTSVGNITGTGAITVTAGGINQNITLTPSGTGTTTINGNLVVGTQASKATITYPTNTARTYTLPDAGANADFVMTAGNQTIAGTKTFSSTISGSISGNSGTSTTLQTTRTLWGQNFNGSADVSGNLTSVGNITGTGAITVTAGGTNQNITLTPSGTGIVNAPTFRATSVIGGGFQGIDADTALQPSFTWSGDISTGIYRPTTNTVGITTAGTESLRVSPGVTTVSGNLVLGTQASKATITYPTNTSRTYTIPSSTTNANFVITESNQTINGVKTFSTNILGDLSGNSTTASNISGGSGGEILYQSSANVTEKLPNGTSGQVLSSSGGTSAPTWLNAVSTNTANSLVLRDASGGFNAGNINSAGNILFGNSGTSARATLTYGSTTNRTYNFPIGFAAGNTTEIIIADGSQTITGQKTFTGGIIGDLQGTATNSTNAVITANSSNLNFFVPFVNGTTGNRALQADTELFYNPNTNVLRSGNFLGGLHDVNFRRIYNPEGATYNASVPTVSGALRIQLPVYRNGSMFKMKVEIFNYSSQQRSCTLYCGAYLFTTNPPTQIINPFAYIISNPNQNNNLTVRFATDEVAQKQYVLIGETDTVWNLPNFQVTEVEVGFSGFTRDWTFGWVCDTTTDLSGLIIHSALTDCQIGYQASTNIPDSVVLRDGSGNFSAGTITASLNGNATSSTTATNANNIAVTDTTTTAGTFYPAFTSGTTGNQVLRTDSSTLTYTPSTNTLATTTFSGALSGNATTATTLQNTRALWGQNFNGSADISGNLTSVGNITGSGPITVTAGGTNQNITLTPSGTGNTTINGNLVVGTQASKATITYPTNTTRTYTLPDAGANADFVMTAGNQTIAGTKTFSSTISGSISGNSGTATTLQNTRALWGQNFNGSADVSGNLTSVGNITGSGAITVTAGGTNQNITLTPSGTGTVNAPTFRATSLTGGGFQGIDADTALQPSFTWNGDISTGIYRPTTNTVGITTGGVERMRISSDLTRLTTDFDISKNSAIYIEYWSSPSNLGNGAVTKNYFTQYGAGVYKQIEDTINESGQYFSFNQSGLSNSNGQFNRYFQYYTGDVNALNGYSKFEVNARTKLWLKENSEVILGGEDFASTTWASPVLRATDMITGTNLVGRDLTIQSGRGRGLGGSGSINFNTSPPDASGTTLNTPIRRMTITNTGNVGISTTSPNSLLDLGNAFHSGAPSTLNQAINKLALWSSGTTPNYGLGISTSLFNITAGESTGSIAFRTGGITERMRIDASGTILQSQPTPTAFNVTGTLTVDQIESLIITSTTAAAVSATLPTGTLMDTIYNSNINMALDWCVINTGAANPFTLLAAASGHTIVGRAIVSASTSAMFRSSRTAANTWITYRLS